MISKKTKYTLKALRDLAKIFEKRESLTLLQLAEQNDIPKSFLEIILCDLRRNEIIGLNKGKFGGYFLLIPPESVKLARIIRLMDGPIAPTSCASLHFYGKCTDCLDEITCKIKPLMIKIRDANLSVYENTSIIDLI